MADKVRCNFPILLIDSKTIDVTHFGKGALTALNLKYLVKIAVMKNWV